MIATLNTASLPVIAALARITFIAAHNDAISTDLHGVLQYSSPRADGKYHSCLWFGKDPSTILQFISKNYLPLWLTSASSFNNEGVQHNANGSNDHMYWLLPTCTLELSMGNPILSLQIPVLSPLLSSIVTVTCDENERDRAIDGVNDKGDTSDIFLFPALRAALTTCYLVLRERNHYLTSAKSSNDNYDGLNASDEWRMYNQQEAKLSPNEITTLENTLLKPDIVNAMKLLATGLVRKLKFDSFLDQSEDYYFAGYIANLDTDLFWMLCPDAQHRGTAYSNSPTFWCVWVANIRARCVALQFCCLAQLSGPEDTIQVAWPSTQQSLGIWRGGGEAIRKALARKIERERSVPHIELAVTVLACGQRAAARSLLAPSSTRSILRRLARRAKDNEKGKCDKKNKKAEDETPNEETESNIEVMAAIVQCLSTSHTEWMTKAQEFSAIHEAGGRNIDKYVDVGQMCLILAACVRFLRVAWGSQNNRWFDAPWKNLNVWEVLANLVRCKSSTSRQQISVDFAHAISYPEISVVSADCLKDKGAEDWTVLRSIIQDMAVAIDVSACWKVIAADVLELFSAEISSKTTASLKSPNPDQNRNASDRTESKDSIPVDVFREGVFAHFSSVFTEKWMHVLFKLSDHPNDASNALERRMSRRSLKDMDVNPSSTSISVEERSRQVSNSMANLIFSKRNLNSNNVIQYFQRGGDVNTRFGSDYYFDTGRVLRFLQMPGRSVEETCTVLEDFYRLNMDLTIQDVQAEVVRSFSTMSSAIVFVDSFCPQPSMLLTYSSPQFGGKVCRFLARYLLFISPMSSSSWHAVGITSEISMLMASLSTRLSLDELDQAALTAVRFQSLQLSEVLSSLNVIGQLCVVVDDIMDSVAAFGSDQLKVSGRLHIIRWLLLSTSKLVKGAAFRSRSNLMAVTRCVMRVLRERGHVPFVSSACSVSLSSVLEQNLNAWTASLEAADVKVLVKTISSLAALHGQERNACREISANLLLITAHGYFLQVSVDNDTRSFVIRQLTGGSVMGMCPPESDTIATYDANSDSRHSSHILWCSCLRLASIAISDAVESRQRGGGDDEIRDVLEFSFATITRLARDSLSMSGDWPSYAGAEARFLTIAKVEEAELAALALFRLSG